MKQSLVIVESPAKARTLSRILGKSYSLKASMGHVRDLPRSSLGVDVASGFVPKYVVPRSKSKVVRELKQAVKNADKVYLATDPDREGEAISWHLAEVTNLDGIPYYRVIFHEITEEAIKHAFKHPRPIDQQLVNAQQARRILDRLVGYKISPLLWRKIRKGLSAGRVQSVAVRIVVDREREIQKFIPEEYWTIEAELAKRKTTVEVPFRAILIGFTDRTKLKIHNQKEAEGIRNELEKADYSILKVGTKKITRQPAPPFITSTIQQEAWRKLRFSAGYTMALAQQLYEGLPIGNEGNVGLITYMRTDSTHVAPSAITEAREFISQKYGPQYVPPHARHFTRKVKGAQEAHEAIRPTKTKREPHLIKKYLNANQFKLYELIWQRMVASQMSAALYDSTTVDTQAKCPASVTDYLLRTSTSVISFPGFTILYNEGKDEPDKEERKAALPPLAEGDELKLLGLFPEQHFTQPPPRFTEATLVKMLEQNGIGRPSTYAPILSTIQEREYVIKTEGSLRPTELGFLVNDLLCQHFPNIVDVKFTAQMEDELDEIANKSRDWPGVVQDFYTPFEKSLLDASERIEKVKIPDQPTDEVCSECGKPLVIKIGRYGKFIACSGYPECKYTRTYQVKTGAKCPEDGGEVIERVSKKKRIFYGCSNYPKCTFATRFKPLPQPCPKCGSLLTLYRQNWAKCVKCDYKDKLADLESSTRSKV